MYPYYIIRERYPNVKEITFRVIESNAWIGHNKTFSLKPDMMSNFFIKCPYECMGGEETGIWLYGDVSQMVAKELSHLQKRFKCNGYERSKNRFSCEWYVDLDIEIIYLPNDEIK